MNLERFTKKYLSIKSLYVESSFVTKLSRVSSWELPLKFTNSCLQRGRPLVQYYCPSLREPPFRMILIRYAENLQADYPALSKDSLEEKRRLIQKAQKEK